MQPIIAKVSFPEFRRFLEDTGLHGRLADDWMVESLNRGFSDHMGAGEDTDGLIRRIKSYKMMEEGYYGDSGADLLYILDPDDDTTENWDEALYRLVPHPRGDADAAETWRERIDALIPEVQAAQLEDYIYDDGKSSDFLIFACDVVDIMERQWSTLHAKRS